MKNSKWLLFLMIPLLLVGCQKTSSSGDSTTSDSIEVTSEHVISSEDITSSEISEQLSSASEIISSEDSEEELPSESSEPLPVGMSVTEAKAQPINTVVEVEGIVGKVWYGTTSNSPQAIYIFDEENILLVYGANVASQVSVGRKVVLSGTLIHFILDTDVEGAGKINYQGSLQIGTPTLLGVHNGTFPIPNGGLELVRVKTIVDTPVTTNITSKYYKSLVKIEKVQGQGFSTYYFNDLNGDDRLLLYTSANGKDHNWLDAYVNENAYFVTYAIYNARVSDSVWRISPISVLEIGEATNSDYVTFALERLAAQFNESYAVDVTINLLTSDVQTPEAVIEYATTSEQVTIDPTLMTMSFDTSTYEEAAITITISYQGIIQAVEVIVILTDRPLIETISVSEARSKSTGDKVVVSGVVIGYSYNGTSSYKGFYIGDATGQVQVMSSDESLLNQINLNEEVIIEATVNIHATNLNYSLTLNAILFQDFGTHEVDETTIETKTITELNALSKESGYTTRLFKTTATVEIYASGSGAYIFYNIRLIDPLNPTGTTLTIYSSNSSSNPDTREHDGETVDVYVSLLNINSQNYWRAEIVKFL